MYKRQGRGWYGENRLPDWVKNQRESWHGVDYQYHGALPYEEDFRNYCETVTSMDDAIGRLLDFLQAEGLGESTLVIYMGDNGFTWGEHGLIDKRNFYEPSVRVPMLAYCPELIPAGRTVEEMVQNIDVAPTIMAACGLAKDVYKRQPPTSFSSSVTGNSVAKSRTPYLSAARNASS